MQELIKTTIHFLKSEVEEREGTWELWEVDKLLMGTIRLFSCIKSVYKTFFSLIQTWWLRKPKKLDCSLNAFFLRIHL